MKVAVIGAGPTGLSVAYLLRKRGVAVSVYEAGSREGGLAGTFKRNGFAFDFGPHEFCTDNPALISLLEEVCGDDLLRIRKRTSQHFNGKFLRYPFGIGDVLRHIHPFTTCRALIEIGGARLRGIFRGMPNGSFEEWTRGRFGKTLYRAYFGPYTKKVWGIDPAELDVDTARERISVDSVRDLLRKSIAHRVLGIDDFSKAHSEFRDEFLYTRGGAGTLHHHFARKVVDAGGELHFGKRLEGVSLGTRGVESIRFEDGTTHSADYVVSTIPLPHLTRMCLGDEAKPLLAANELPFRGMAFVFLQVNLPQVTNDHWTYFPDPSIPFQRMTEFGHFEAGMAPPDKTGLALEIAMSPGDAAWNATDAELAARCIDSLQELDLLSPNDVLGFDVVRQRHAYPIQIKGHKARSRALLDALSPISNLVSIGRQGLFRYCNQNECLEMALEIVPQIAAAHPRIRYSAAGSWVGIGITNSV